jgi:hypothetical protein
MSVVPEKISLHEALTHALFYPSDINKQSLWIKRRTLIPPKKMPSEVSFNRACYLDDSKQKSLAKKIKRLKAYPKGFIRLNRQKLKDALTFMVNHGKVDAAYINMVDFIYTPIYDERNLAEGWPVEIPKEEHIGYNPAHADLKFSDVTEENETSKIATAFSSFLSEKEDHFCEVFLEKEEDCEKENWHGPDLC